MEITNLIPHIEALIFASDKPLTTIELTEYINTALGFIEDRASHDQVESALEGIKEKYNSEFYSFELKQSGGGWQFLTKPEFHKTVALINGDKFIKRLSSAALETLAIIAYRQPVTRPAIDAIRGVNSDGVLKSLLGKGLIEEMGRAEGPGRPILYGVTAEFLQNFGLSSLAQLPPYEIPVDDKDELQNGSLKENGLLKD